MTCTDEDLKQLNKLLTTSIEDTQFYQGYPERCKAYAKALKAILARLEVAEERASYLSMFAINDTKADEYERVWRETAGKMRTVPCPKCGRSYLHLPPLYECEAAGK